MAKTETKPCEYCGKPVTKTATQQSQRKYWTCDRSCSASLAHQRGNSPRKWGDNPHRGQKETRPCVMCGKPVTRYLRPDNADKKWTCSYTCAGKRQAIRQKEDGTYTRGRKPRTGDYVNCSMCGKEFYRQPAYIEQGRHLCSKECNAAWQGRHRTEKTCKYCGKTFEVKPSQAGRKYCSMECYGKGRIKRHTGRAHNGRPVILNAQGYLTVYEPDHPSAHHNGRVLEHRLVMEKKLGRPLEKDEHVHHINHDKQDNRPENLRVIDPSMHGQESSRYRDRKMRRLEKKLAEYKRRFGPLEGD